MLIQNCVNRSNDTVKNYHNCVSVSSIIINHDWNIKSPGTDKCLPRGVSFQILRAYFVNHFEWRGGEFLWQTAQKPQGILCGLLRIFGTYDGERYCPDAHSASPFSWERQHILPQIKMSSCIIAQKRQISFWQKNFVTGWMKAWKYVASHIGALGKLIFWYSYIWDCASFPDLSGL